MGSRLLQRAAVSTLFALRWREVRFTMIFRWAILLGCSASLRCPDSPYTVALASILLSCRFTFCARHATFGFRCTRRQANRTRLSAAAGLDRAHARGQALPGQLAAPGRCCGAAQLELQCDAPRRDCRHRHGALRCVTQPRAHHQACFASICFWPSCGVLPSSDVSLPPSWRNLGHHRTWTFSDPMFGRVRSACWSGRDGQPRAPWRRPQRGGFLHQLHRQLHAVRM